MSDKQVYDLVKEDLERSPVWYFPMDSSVEDELTARPLLSAECGTDFQVIVRTSFYASNGAVCLGYIYWSEFQGIDTLQPVMFLDDCAVSFWYGMSMPNWDDYPESARSLKGVMPIRFLSDAVCGLSSIEGVLNGLYYVGPDGEYGMS